MKRKILTGAIVFFTVLGFAFGKEKILHAETQYFDIIFDESTRESAQELYGCADDVLEELCLQFKVKPNFKIPVVLTSKTEIFNAYFTNYNYNHIVIYDSIPQENMMVFSKSVKSTFTHELTHLVSINSKNGFWRNFGKIFGDIYNPGCYITMTSFFKEGASVYQESKNGEGRLKDGFFLHDLRQAKLSGKFPGYTDCFGARTIYPYGTTSYIFGSAFTEYIIEKYGMDKYAEFWHRGINSNRLTSTAVFKKTYGISMKKEWKNFYDSIDVSGIEKNPDSINGIRKSNLKNKSLHLYSVIGRKEDTDIIWDETTESVFLGNKKLFTKTGLVSAKASHDGKYIFTTYADPNHLNQQIKGCYFNTENNSWKKLEDNGIRQLCIFNKDGKEFLAIVKSLSQKCSLKIVPINKDNSILCSVEFPRNEVIYSLCSDENGNLFFLLKDGLKFSLCRAAFDDNQIEYECFHFENIRPSNLSIATHNAGKTTALFTYVEGKSFPRLAVAEINGNEMELKLLQKDFSGGIYSPVMKGEKILYAARFYTEGALYELDPVEFQKTFNSTIINAEAWQPNLVSAETESNASDLNFSTYGKFLYPKQTIVPLSVLNSYYISPSVYYTDEIDCLSQPSYSYLLGITVLRSNPWDTKHIGITAGYSPAKKAGGTGIIFSGKSSSGNFTVNNTLNSIFNIDGFMQANNSFGFSWEFLSGNISRIMLSESNVFLYGKEDMNKETSEFYLLDKNQLNKKYLYDKNILSIAYSTMRKIGSKTCETAGFKIAMNFKNVYATTDAKKEESIFDNMIHYENDRIQFAQLYPSLEISIPGLLPFDCKGPFIYNLPLYVFGTLFQFNDSFACLGAEATLFSWEVQKGFGVVPLYLGTLTLKTFYQEEYTTGLNRNMEIRYMKEDLDNFEFMGKNKYAGGSLVFILGGNTGALADKNINVSVTCKGVYCLEGSHKGETKFLMTSALNFPLF